MAARRTGDPVPATRATRIGVFGGTFDPIHLGHLVCAEQLRDALGLDRVILIPCSRSPHKPRCRLAPSRHRLEMARLAVRGRRGLSVSDLEIARGGVSYTVDTVRQLRRRLGARAEIWLLLGADAYRDVAAWQDPQTVIRECCFGVAGRPGYRKITPSWAGRARTRFVRITPVDLSSTDVRLRVAAGRSVRFLVPGPVEAYIERHGLYRRGGRGGADRGGGTRRGARCRAPSRRLRSG